jgi:hypothetical protein
MTFKPVRSANFSISSDLFTVQPLFIISLIAKEHTQILPPAKRINCTSATVFVELTVLREEKRAFPTYKMYLAAFSSREFVTTHPFRNTVPLTQTKNLLLSYD